MDYTSILNMHQELSLIAVFLLDPSCFLFSFGYSVGNESNTR